MQSTNSEAQITQSGQAIIINNITCKQLYELFAPMIGPNGKFKVLVEGAGQITISRDGNLLCRNLQFQHPTSILIANGGKSLFEATGDGIKTFVILCCDIFCQSYEFYNNGTPIAHIVNSLHLVLNDIILFLKQNAIPLDKLSLDKLIFSSLVTKIRNPEFLVDILKKVLSNLSQARVVDVDMVEIMKMEGGDIRNSVFIDGLVLDHSGRHPEMPLNLSDVCVLVSNMSLEYEKPEINAEFCYSSAEKRDEIALNENDFIVRKANAIADFARKIKESDNKSLLFITEKGIDLDALEILAKAGVLGLRRAKRRNLERIIRMCGGRIVTEISQINRDCVGYCHKVVVKDFGDNKYTIMEGMPNKGACTILLRGDCDYNHYSKSIRGTIHAVFLALKSKCCIKGGTSLYKNMIEHLTNKAKTVHSIDAVGYKIIVLVFKNFIRTLFKNEGMEIEESMTKLFRGEITSDVIENLNVLSFVINSALMTATNLLLCDEIIKAGRAIKQQENE